MNELQFFLRNTAKTTELGTEGLGMFSMQEVRPAIRCADGESVSIQASKHHYCTPREDGELDYIAIEAGFPSCTPPESWKKYAEEWEQLTFIEFLRALWRGIKWFMETDGDKTMLRQAWRGFVHPLGTNTVYAYVPIEIAWEFVEEHGGIDPEWNWLIPEETVEQIISDFGKEE